MNNTLRNILAVVLGWFAGSIVNMALVQLGYYIYPIPNVDTNNLEALTNVMPSLSSKHFIFPFLAHAVGTLVGAFITALIVLKYKVRFALVIGTLFFIGGIIVNMMLPAPTWFKAVDLLLAYMPMAFAGGFLAKSLKKTH
ncbi:hypothetical protein [Aurantibacter aestuarii]|uniref:Uncharacterized protein n=1 Tax=Aurantibacter aestuarii TaxID=1266046 RepID=A0A2T1NA26_9FLAO|nr:hypothetical protein [Aurantibacter aestuarii]PSG88683.1 hypothetical protein C7H52_10350 [Aurantibacter aestuarii]